MPIINRIADYFDEMQEWRHYMHANPELGFDCFNTAKFVKSKLEEFGVDEIFTEIAVVCMTLHQVFTYKDIPNDDISVVLAVLKKEDNTWKMIHGARSQGRSPTDPPPVFPSN